jgi:hypothetical protein
VEKADGGLVVEIVTDDMPFLVAALLAAITRAGGESAGCCTRSWWCAVRPTASSPTC